MNDDNMVDSMVYFGEQIYSILAEVKKVFLQLGKALSEFFSKEKIQNRRCPKRVSYNAKYWKITDDNKLNIQLMVKDFGSNDRGYYSKMYI